VKVNIFWFRRDLRLEDNKGFHFALRDELPVIPIFLFDKNILDKLTNKSDKRVDLIHQIITELKKELQSFCSDLYVDYSTPIDAWKKLLDQFEVNKVFFNEDYEPGAIARDNDVCKLLKTKGVEVESFKDQCIFSKNDVLKQDGKPYTVYTPYKNKWLTTLTPKDILSFQNKKFFKNLFKVTKNFKIPSLDEMGFTKLNIDIPQKIIKKKKIESYHTNRDLPYIDGTSHLSFHLRFGLISPRKCAQVGMELNKVWLEELIWREFFMQILFHFPYVTNAPFREKYNHIAWINNKSDFKKWCEGKTGYPIVDAGMRELNETGFMHNRVRMITASFLVKHLLIDWRWGEKYFAEKLIDYDQSANNGNWQWVAGTGCDAAPYFRVFNPYTQQKKFDPDFIYIKKWIKEYNTESYPKEMVEHSFAYRRAINTYQSSIS